MVGENHSPEVFRFGIFAVDVRARELRKQACGSRFRINPSACCQNSGALAEDSENSARVNRAR